MSFDPDIDRLAVLVHEVRSPVAALSAIAGALSDGALDLAARRELVRLAALASRAIERIVADAAVASIHLETTDPVALVRDAVIAARLRGFQVALAAPERAPAIEADPARLRQVLDNLISNAVAHGGPGADVSVSVRVGEGLQIDVSDTGAGIAEDELETIFDAGVRLDPERPGSGLGLALARSIAEGHRGTLTVVSAPGAGARFTISLPFSEL